MYSPEAYDSLPPLRTAAALVNDEARSNLSGPIRDFFLENEAHHEWGVALLHKHFPIEGTERLVDCRSSSTAWKIGEGMQDVVPQYTGFIAPRSYRLHDSMAVPYEFEFSAEEPNLDNLFPTRALQLLSELGLATVSGLRRLTEHDPTLSVEITEGKTNIMMPRASVPDSELIEALWIFKPGDDDKCHCREQCWPKKDGHDEDHSCG